MADTSLSAFRQKYGQAAYNAMLKQIEAKPPTARALDQFGQGLMLGPKNKLLTQTARVRGSSNVPLNSTGLAQADDLGRKFAARGGLDMIFSGPLDRARHTAIAIARHTNTPVQTTDTLLPWKLGIFEGQPVDNVKDMLAKLANDHPDESAPGRSLTSTEHGESFNSFKHRLIGKFLAPLMLAHAQDPRGKIGAISHLRDILAAKSWIKNGTRQDMQFDHHDVDYEHSASEEKPASVFRIHADDGNKWKFENEDMDDSAPLLPGIYMIRHGDTNWNSKGETTS